MKENKGITLISLVITIIILIILAGVAINLSLGENGILNKAQLAKEQYINAQGKEQTDINDVYSEIIIATNENAKINISVEDLNKLIDQKVNEKMYDFSDSSEITVGKWTDGSIIYRKIVTFTMNANSSYNAVTLVDESINYKEIIDIKGTWTNSSGCVFSANDAYNYFYIENSKLYYVNRSTMQSASITAAIYYTK